MATQTKIRYVIVKRGKKHARYTQASYPTREAAEKAIANIHGGNPDLYVAEKKPRGQYTPNP